MKLNTGSHPDALPTLHRVLSRNSNRRFSAKGNSGINYRSPETPGLKWSVTGYQGDIEGGPRWTGQSREAIPALARVLTRPSAVPTREALSALT